MENKLRFMNGVICNSSAVDETTKNLSVFSMIDQISVDLKAQDPTKTRPNAVEKIPLPINFQVISLWKRKNLSDIGKEVTSNLQVEELDPLGNSLRITPIPLSIPKSVIRSRHVLNVQGITVTISGEYCFQFREVFSDGNRSDVLATLYLDIGVNKS